MRTVLLAIAFAYSLATIGPAAPSFDGGFSGEDASVRGNDVKAAPGSKPPPGGTATPRTPGTSTNRPKGGATKGSTTVPPSQPKTWIQLLSERIIDCTAGAIPGFSGITGCGQPAQPAAANAQQNPNTPAPLPTVTPGLVQQQLVSLPIPASKLRSQLNGFSLRNANTNIYADGSPHTLNTTILGQPVTITVTPIRYTFGYGDGATRTTTTPGGPLKDDGFETPTTTGHNYKETGKYSITLTTHYSGTFSVNGGPTQTIPGTAAVDSTPMALQIWRTKHYQVQAPCTPGSTAPGCGPPGG